MDDQTFMASYVADETTRMKDRLKNLVESGVEPTEEEKEQLMADMQASFARLEKMLTQMQGMLDAEEDEDEKLPV